MNRAFQAMAVTWPPQKSIFPFIRAQGNPWGILGPLHQIPHWRELAEPLLTARESWWKNNVPTWLRGVKSRPSSSSSLTPVHDFSFLLVDLVRWLIKMHVRNSRLTPHFKPTPPSLCVNSCRLCQSKYIWDRSTAVVIVSYSSDHTREGQLHQTKDNCFPPNLWTSLLT